MCSPMPPSLAEVSIAVAEIVVVVAGGMVVVVVVVVLTAVARVKAQALRVGWRPIAIAAGMKL